MKEYLFIDQIVSVKEYGSSDWHDGMIDDLAPGRREVRIVYLHGTRWTNRNGSPERGNWRFR